MFSIGNKGVKMKLIKFEEKGIVYGLELDEESEDPLNEEVKFEEKEE